jgi:hypothetical protein
MNLDSATTSLYRSVLESEPHHSFIEAVQRLMQDEPEPTPRVQPRLVIVPAAFYQENPRSGADGHVVRAQAERLGWTVDSIPLVSDGSMAENARIITDWLGAQRDSQLVLVSLSKGGADIKLALSQPGAEQAFDRVACWINLWHLKRHALVGLAAVVANRSRAEPALLPHVRREHEFHDRSSTRARRSTRLRARASSAHATDQRRRFSAASAHDERARATLL